MTNEEKIAAGYVFGYENLGQTISERVGYNIKIQNWAMVTRIINSEMGSIAESDEMYDGMKDEINSWIKLMNKGDISTLSMWEKEKVRCTSYQYKTPEEQLKHAFSGINQVMMKG